MRIFGRVSAIGDIAKVLWMLLVLLQLKMPWRNGTTHLVMSPLEFMQRLAALAR